MLQEPTAPQEPNEKPAEPQEPTEDSVKNDITGTEQENNIKVEQKENNVVIKTADTNNVWGIISLMVCSALVVLLTWKGGKHGCKRRSN